MGAIIYPLLFKEPLSQRGVWVLDFIDFLPGDMVTRRVASLACVKKQTPSFRCLANVPISNISDNVSDDMSSVYLNEWETPLHPTLLIVCFFATSTMISTNHIPYIHM